MPEVAQDLIYDGGPIDRTHYAAVASGSTNDAVWKRLMRQWYGLTPARKNWSLGANCPHRLVGRRCGVASCHWSYTKFSPVWDHARLWTYEGELVLTLEPYGNPWNMANKFDDLERSLDAMGISTAFEGRSPYGASFILFLAAESTEFGRRARHYRSRREVLEAL